MGYGGCKKRGCARTPSKNLSFFNTKNKTCTCIKPPWQINSLVQIVHYDLLHPSFKISNQHKADLISMMRLRTHALSFEWCELTTDQIPFQWSTKGNTCFQLSKFPFDHRSDPILMMHLTTHVETFWNQWCGWGNMLQAFKSSNQPKIRYHFNVEQDTYPAFEFRNHWCG